MARPRKQGLDYFPHDVDASNDEKIEALRALYGNDGYAFYFILLERIYRTLDAELDLSKPAILAALIAKVGVPAAKFYEILETSFDVGCFSRETYENDNVLTSNGIKRRYLDVQELRDRWRKAKDPPTKDTNSFPRENPVENHAENATITRDFSGFSVTQRKEKKRKEKEKKKERYNPPYIPPLNAESEKADTQGSNAHTEKSNAHSVKVQCAEYVSMTNAEHEKLLSTYGPADTARMIEKLDNYKGSTGKKYRSDYRAILSWVADEVLKNKHETIAKGHKSTLGMLQELYAEEVTKVGTGRDN